MNIIDVLDKNNVLLNLKSKEKNDVITELLQSLHDSGYISSIEEVKNEILKRENAMSTGIGKSIGLPHCKFKGINKIIIAVGRNKDGIDEYSSLDDEPVKLIFMLISPDDQPSLHINMLARISRIVKQDYIRNSLMSAQSAKKFLEIIKNEDKKFL